MAVLTFLLLAPGDLHPQRRVRHPHRDLDRALLPRLPARHHPRALVLLLPLGAFADAATRSPHFPDSSTLVHVSSVLRLRCAPTNPLPSLPGKMFSSRRVPDDFNFRERSAAAWRSCDVFDGPSARLHEPTPSTVLRLRCVRLPLEACRFCKLMS